MKSRRYPILSMAERRAGSIPALVVETKIILENAKLKRVVAKKSQVKAEAVNCVRATDR